MRCFLTHSAGVANVVVRTVAVTMRVIVLSLAAAYSLNISLTYSVKLPQTLVTGNDKLFVTFATTKTTLALHAAIWNTTRHVSVIA